MLRAAAVLVGITVLTACAGSEERVTSVDAAPQEQAPEGFAHSCPDPGPIPPEDRNPNPPPEVVVLSGDFGDEPWCLSVSESTDIGPCISIRGRAAPEGQQLSSGACDGDLSMLSWHVTGQAEPGYVAYGHAPANATQVRLFAAGDAVDTDTHRSPQVQDATFFAVRLPFGFFPERAAAYNNGREIERKDAVVADLAD